jgi:hypothetical protein
MYDWTRCMGSRDIDPCILNTGTRWRWMSSLMSQPLDTCEKSPQYPLDRRLGGSLGQFGWCRGEKNLLFLLRIKPWFLSYLDFSVVMKTPRWIIHLKARVIEFQTWRYKIWSRALITDVPFTLFADCKNELSHWRVTQWLPAKRSVVITVFLCFPLIWTLCTCANIR